MNTSTPLRAARRGSAAVVAACAFAGIAAVILMMATSTYVSAQNTGAQGAAPAKAAAANKDDASYSLGVSMGSQLHEFGLGAGDVSLERVMQGLRDALAGTAKATPEDNAKIGALIQEARTALAARNKETGRKFLAENARKKGVVTTASGLQYRVINAGKGNPPKLTDQVTVHYRGTLLDGTEFDSSIRRGEPASFPVNGVIPGWQEALQLMKPGAKFELFIPPELAYDENSPPPIPPGSVLQFEVELLDVKPAGAGQPGSTP